MATIVDNLIGLFNDPEADTSHDALCDRIREYVNADTAGDIHLSDEIQVGRDRFNDLYNGGDFEPRHAPDMRMLSNIVKALGTIKAEAEEARAELDAEFANAASEITAASEQGLANDPEGEDEEDHATPDPDDDDNGGDNGDDGDGEDEGSAPEPEPAPAEPVAAAASKPRVRPASAPVRLPSSGEINAFRSGAGNTGAAQHVRRKYSIVAAADVPRTTSGSTLSMRELAVATNNRFTTMPVGQKGVGSRRGAIALVKRTFDRSLETHNDRRDQATIDAVADESNLPGGSLVAAARGHRQALTAAGCVTSMSNDIWCAPSETDYTLCDPLSSLEGMVDLPTVPVTRGGIRYPVWTQMPFEWHGQVVHNDCETPLAPDHFEQEENFKTCISGPCPEWQERRLSIQYLCIEGDILRERGYPELTERFISDALVAHAHFMNHNYLAEIFERSDALPGFNVGGDGIGSISDSIIDRLGLLIAWMRERYKMTMSATLEGIAPVWLREYIKLDLARKSNRPYGSVSDFEVDDLFAAYTTRVQWVYDTEGITADASLVDGAPVNGRPMPGAWPNNTEMVFFPAGSWVLGQQDIISLDAFYDSEKLKSNKYTALFMEEGFLLLNRCNRSFRVRLENLCRSGGVAEQIAISCPPSDGGGDASGAGVQTLSAPATTSGSGGSGGSGGSKSTKNRS